MLTSGFTNAPVTKFLVFYTVAAAFLASITDSQYLLYIQVVPHLWVHRQFWRLLTWQVWMQPADACLTDNGLKEESRPVSRIPPRCCSPP